MLSHCKPVHIGNFHFWCFRVYSLTVSAFIKTKVCPKLHVSVASGPMPVLVMIHRLIDKIFWVSVAFGVLALASSAMGLIWKVLMCSHPEASLLLGSLLSKPPGCAAHCLLSSPSAARYVSLLSALYRCISMKFLEYILKINAMFSDFTLFTQVLQRLSIDLLLFL